MKDRVVIITGGGTGIGRAAAMQFVQAGAWVVLVGRRAASLEATASTSDRIVPVPANLLREDELERVIHIANSRANPVANWVTGQVIVVDGGLSIT